MTPDSPELRLTFIVAKLANGRTDVPVSRADVEAEAHRLDIFRISEKEFRALVADWKASRATS